MEKEKPSTITYLVFAGTITIIAIYLISLFFPALIVSSTSRTESNIEPFEVGAWAIPFITVNIIVLIFSLLYFTKKLPIKMQNAIKFILNFEISNNVAAVSITILLGLYVGSTMSELNAYEGDTWGDFERIEDVLRDYPFGEEGMPSLRILHVTNFLLHSSQVVFQNIKVIPFIASISLLLLTYFFTVQISKKRFAGIVAIIIVLQSSTFLQYDTLATYTNFWTLLYLVSLYVIYKKWYLSPIAYVASIFSKPLTAPFFPMTLFLTYRAEIPRRKKIYILISYVVIVSIMAGVVFFAFNPFIVQARTFNSEEFWSGFSTWAFQLRFDGLVLVFLLPVTVGLFFTSRKGILEADSVMILIMGTLLVMPLMAALTGVNIHPYRYIPHIVFFAVGVGTLLSKKSQRDLNTV